MTDEDGLYGMEAVVAAVAIAVAVVAVVAAALAVALAAVALAAVAVAVFEVHNTISAHISVQNKADRTHE